MAQPNIIFIHVDEMRFPMHLPANAPTPDAFLAKYMPNLYSLWTKGVKFKRYFTAAADCTPGRGTFVTGLYAYQTGLFLTRESTSNPYATKQPQPALHPDFPTYGKVLREPRPGFTPYETPYIGKRSEEHTSELQSHVNLVCRLLLEKKNKKTMKLLINRNINTSCFCSTSFRAGNDYRRCFCNTSIVRARFIFTTISIVHFSISDPYK